MSSVRLTLATAGGFALGGIALHSPGASAVGASCLEWEVSAAVFRVILGSVVGAVTGLLQMLALGIRSWRLVVASVIAVAVTRALADGAPAAWSVGGVAAISGLGDAVVLAWGASHASVAMDPRERIRVVGELDAGVAIAAALKLSGGTTPGVWATEHAVILGLSWGVATSPDARHLLEESRFFRSAG